MTMLPHTRTPAPWDRRHGGPNQLFRHSLPGPRPAPFHHGRGAAFTLVELLFVLLIMSILLGVGIFRLSRLSVTAAGCDRATRRLVADLQYARSQAIADGKNYFLLFDDNGTKYTSYTLYRADPGEDVQVEPARTLPDTITLMGTSLRAEFNSMGEALAGYTYTVTSAGRNYSITVVLATGAIALEEL